MKNKLSWSWILTKRLLNMDNPLFRDGNLVCCLAIKQFTVKEDIDEIIQREADITCGIGTCNKVFKSLVEYESHYNSVHKNVCSICRRFYPTNHLLDIHLLEWHDSMFELLAEKQPMFQCLIPTCSIKLSSRKQRKDHMIKVHKYPSNFRFDREKKAVHTRNDNKKVPVDKKRESTTMKVTDETKHVNSNNNVCQTEEPTTMDMTVETENIQRPKLQYSYKVPQNFSFGHGVSRGFQRKRGGGQRGKTKYWHNQLTESKNMQVDLENVDMNDLADALDTA